jgi:hypothetical protein
MANEGSTKDFPCEFGAGIEFTGPVNGKRERFHEYHGRVILLVQFILDIGKPLRGNPQQKLHNQPFNADT